MEQLRTDGRFQVPNGASQGEHFTLLNMGIPTPLPHCIVAIVCWLIPSVDLVLVVQVVIVHGSKILRAFRGER